MLPARIREETKVTVWVRSVVMESLPSRGHTHTKFNTCTPNVSLYSGSELLAPVSTLLIHVVIMGHLGHIPRSYRWTVIMRMT